MAPLSETYANSHQITSPYQDTWDVHCYSPINESSHTCRKPVRSIAFSPCVTVHNILHIRDYTLEEKQLTWYNRCEIKQVRKEIKETLMLMMANVKFCDSDIFCARGLETESEDGPRMLEHIQEARDAVLDEQNLQFDEKIHDPELLADIYFDCSRVCQKEAQHRARQDEIEAGGGGEAVAHRLHCSVNDGRRKNAKHFVPQRSLLHSNFYSFGNER